jgi:phage gp46-like protein
MRESKDDKSVYVNTENARMSRVKLRIRIKSTEGGTSKVIHQLGSPLLNLTLTGMDKLI